MRPLSTEEKVIYEKLTSAKPAPQNPPAMHEAPASMDIRHVQGLMQKLEGYIGTLEHTRENCSYKPILTHRRLLGPLALFIKRVVRKMVFWYVEPVCQQQTAFNNAVTPAVGCINEISYALIQSALALSQGQEAANAEHRAGLAAAQEALLQNLQAESARQASEREEALQAMEQRLAMRHAELEQRRAELEQRLALRHAELENMQRIENAKIAEMQNKMGQLEKLDIFPAAGTDIHDIITKDTGTFAQCGEDMILAFLVQAFGIPMGEASYIDIGANHAKKLSNTYHFYRRGARGVLAEANPELIAELKFYRSEDVILNKCVTDKSGETVEFYVMGEGADGLSTTDRSEADRLAAALPQAKGHKAVRVETITVGDIIGTYMGRAPVILNIDIEGNEMAVLKSIDFGAVRPFIVVLEMVPFTFPFAVTERDRGILDHMAGAGYMEYAFTGINSIFLDKRQLEGGRWSK